MQLYKYVALVLLCPLLWGTGAYALSLDAVLNSDFGEVGFAIARQGDKNCEGLKTVPVKKRGSKKHISGPAELKGKDTEYILTADIVAPGTAFVISASNVTLNLNGHRVVYNEETNESAGILLKKWRLRDVSIVNGEIVQGSAGGVGNAHGKGANPIRTLSFDGVELAGLRITYRGDSLSGVYIYENGHNFYFHHNEIIDNGTVVSNRHQGVPVVRAHGDNARIEHNVIRDARQIGIRVNGKAAQIKNNEVHLLSSVTNSTGITSGSGEIAFNKVIGKGVHPIGIWPGKNAKVYSNYVETQNTHRGREFGSSGSACMRFGWGGGNGLECYGNTFVVKAKEAFFDNQKRKRDESDSWGRALFVGLKKGQTAYFHHNIIVGVNSGGSAKAAAVGLVFNNMSDGMVFENNVIASNWGNLLLGDLYGDAGGHSLFRNNRIVKLDGGTNYHTIRSLYHVRLSTARLSGNIYEGGASPDDYDLFTRGKAIKELAVCKDVPVKLGCPIDKDAVITATFLDSQKNVLWTESVLRKNMVVAVPYKLLTNKRDGQLHSGPLQEIAPDNWSIELRAGKSAMAIPLSRVGETIEFSCN